MNHALFVGDLDGLGDLSGHAQRLVHGDRAPREALREVFALDEFHHQGTRSARLLDTVDLRDVRMVEGGKRPRFTFEARQPVGISGKGFWQDLQRDDATELRVERPIDFAHAAGANHGLDLARTNPRSWGQSHGASDYSRAWRLLSSPDIA